MRCLELSPVYERLGLMADSKAALALLLDEIQFILKSEQALSQRVPNYPAPTADRAIGLIHEALNITNGHYDVEAWRNAYDLRAIGKWPKAWTKDPKKVNAGIVNHLRYFWRYECPLKSGDQVRVESGPIHWNFGGVIQRITYSLIHRQKYYFVETEGDERIEAAVYGPYCRESLFRLYDAEFDFALAEHEAKMERREAEEWAAQEWGDPPDIYLENLLYDLEGEE